MGRDLEQLEADRRASLRWVVIAAGLFALGTLAAGVWLFLAAG